MTRRQRDRQRPKTRETILQERTDELLQTLYRHGQIARKHRDGDFSTGSEWLDRLRALTDPGLPSNGLGGIIDYTATDTALRSWKREFEVKNKLDKIAEILDSRDEPLQPEEEERIAGLARSAFWRGYDGKKLFEKTGRLKQIKTSRPRPAESARLDSNRHQNAPPRSPSAVKLLLSGEANPGELRGVRMSENTLRWMMRGKVPDVEGANRLHDSTGPKTSRF
ncbi:hypothetical protein [Hoeflea prorocentri]|uniref:Uncharacterized protein n=1 Tax=Hoeflea prorocentri TaxID=1922333 RepID=A0A9X3UL62_9HYPH|nr:hypothetical protein [Hoeflea prorocentri]MCY6380991.1 hypothetical protein [Hoeflea prorocentri]MDA5398791.1 hypothetical protein [Hoeflea prorocentri]